MNSPMVELSREIAFRLHADQVDKAGKPYVEHLEFVALHVETDDEKCVAYLHDSIEDIGLSPDYIEQQFGVKISNAVLSMTHKDGENYFDYIRRVKENSLARSVKLADLAHNMMLERLERITEEDLQRLEKYQKAYSMLTD